MVQLVEIAMRPRIGVLDLRVAVVLDARPHRCLPSLVSGDMPVSGCAYEDRTVFGRFRELALARSGLQAWSAALPGRQFDGLGTAGWTGRL